MKILRKLQEFIAMINPLWLWGFLVWSFFIPLRIILWPRIWLNKRRRRLGLAPAEWIWSDRFLVKRGHVVMTFGYFFWERTDRICWWCLLLWHVFVAFVAYMGAQYVL